MIENRVGAVGVGLGESQPHFHALYPVGVSVGIGLRHQTGLFNRGVACHSEDGVFKLDRAAADGDGVPLSGCEVREGKIAADSQRRDGRVRRLQRNELPVNHQVDRAVIHGVDGAGLRVLGVEPGLGVVGSG